MVYLRHPLSIRYFPRAVFLLLIGFHVYLYSHPEGFVFPALGALYFLVLHLMVRTVRKYELAVYSTGAVNQHTTRGMNNRVLNDIHHTQLAPEFSMFMWVNHQEEVPELPGTGTTPLAPAVMNAVDAGFGANRGNTVGASGNTVAAQPSNAAVSGSVTTAAL